MTPPDHPAGALRRQLADAYGIAFPEDFWQFWQFYQELRRDADAPDLLYDLLGISLAGPFDLLRGVFVGKTPALPYVMHYRYFLDPPEFFTVLLGDTDGLHWGYWLDDPGAPDFYVASYHSNDAYSIDECGRTLFEAVRLALEGRYEGWLEDDSCPEDQRRARLERGDLLRSALMRYATAERRAQGEAYTEQYLIDYQPQRAGAIQTSDGMGIRVPPASYRAWGAAERALIARAERGQIGADDAAALVDLAQACLRAGFAGNALQIGKELWAYGNPYAEQAAPVYSLAYRALGREHLAEILQTHMQHRYRRSVDILAAP